jgi:hypothetical protein
MTTASPGRRLRIATATGPLSAFYAVLLLLLAAASLVA